LGQFVQLPAAQKRPDRSESLVAGRGDRTMHIPRGMDHGSELDNGKSAAEASHALLQEKDWAIGAYPDSKGDHQKYRK
jgi:hypothetical protein